METLPENPALDLVWVLLCSALVMFMQAGFCCLESGLVRAKNTINVATKNVVDFTLCAALFWAVGNALMFGTSVDGWFGSDGFLVGTSGSAPGAWPMTRFLFQLVFCGTAVTIISGAVAERIKFSGYVAIAVVVAAVIYPLFGHWAWARDGNGDAAGWLARLGFVDFAGATVVHSVAAWVALAAVLVVGPRQGRFVSGGRELVGCDLPRAALGTMLLWFGWLGFNGGSTFAFTESTPHILVNTTLAGAFGGLAALTLGRAVRGRVRVEDVMNGILAGLVSVTAAADIVSLHVAALVGTFGGVLSVLGTRALERLRIDDAVGAIPVHGLAGLWGTLSVALFGDLQALGTGLGRLEQLGVQAVGAGVCFLWSFGLGLGALLALRRFVPLRVTAREETLGLNMAEHGASTEIHDLVAAMGSQRRSGDFSTPVRVDPHTEASQIADAYNAVLERVNAESEEREHVVTELRQSEERVRLILETALDAVIGMDAEARIIDWNRQAERIFGWSRDEILGQSIEDTIIPPRLGDLRKRGLEPFLATGESPLLDRRIQLKALRRDGREVPVELSMTALQHGGVHVFNAFVQDISDREEAREALVRAKEETEEAARAKSEFLATMSHEIRTPMNGVIGMTYLLLDTELTAEQREFAETAQNSAEALLALINDILDFSKVESGRLDLDVVAFNLGEVVEDVADLLAQSAESKGLELAVQVEPDVPTFLRGDPGRLRQILINLVGNAVKFTEQGEVVARVAVVEDDDESIVLKTEIRDTGVGIDAEQQSRLFEPFVQADMSTTRRFEGTGLGLSISKRLAELMDGQIGVESEKGRGSTFWFTVRLGKERRKAASAAPPLRLDGFRILVVDDNATNRRIATQYVETWGARHDSAEDGATALERLREAFDAGEPHDAAILDLQMPGMDGLELAREIMADPRLKDIKLVLLTSLGRRSDAETARDVGILGYLTKPMRPSRLLETLVEALGVGETESAASPRPDPEGCMEGASSAARILLAEDNVVNQKVAVRLLENLGHEVGVAANGRLAVEALERESYDLVLMDCQMPEMDGLAATAAIRQRPELAGLPVVAMTANAMQGDRERCLAAGMNDYLAKPFKAPQLAAMIERWVSSETRGLPGPANDSSSWAGATSTAPEDHDG